MSDIREERYIMFEIIEKDDKIYKKNINPDGMCKYYQELRCICCNEMCDYNCSIDDLLNEELEEEIWRNMT